MKRLLVMLVLMFGSFGSIMANDIPDLSNLSADGTQSTDANPSADQNDNKPQDPSDALPDLQIPSLDALPQDDKNAQNPQEALPDLSALPLAPDDKNAPKPEPGEDTIELPKEKFSTMPEEKKGIVKSGPGVAKQEAEKKKLEARKAKEEAKKAKEEAKEAKAKGAKKDGVAADANALPNIEAAGKKDAKQEPNIQDLGDISNIANMKGATDAPVAVPGDSAPKIDNSASENKEELSDEAYLNDEDDVKTDKAAASANLAESNNETKEPEGKVADNKPAKAMSAPKVQLEENTASSKSDVNKEVSFVQEDFYELDDDDFEFETRSKGKDKEYILRVMSLDLEAFVNGQSYDEKNQVQTFGVNDNFTQILSKDGKIKEYKFYQKGAKKNTILNTMRMPLEKIDFDTFKIVAKSLPRLFDATACKVIIKKELNATLNQSKEVIMDLDIKRELKNTTNFKLFLECPR